MPTAHAPSSFRQGRTSPSSGVVALRRRTLLGAGVAAALTLAWAGSTTWYILARDEIAGRFLAHQAEQRYAYEDRIASLKSRLEREVTQSLVERTQTDRRLDALARRQAEIEARHGWLRQLAERTGASGGDRPPSPAQAHAAPEPAAAAAAGSAKPAPLLDTAASGVLRPNQDGSEALPRDRLSILEGSLNRVSADEPRIVEAFRRTTQARLARLRSAIAVAGLDPDRFAAAPAQGGPLIPLPPGLAGQALAPAAAETEARILELTRLRDAARAMPLARPVAGDLDQTSGFGYRLDPFTRSAALHSGLDFRAETGTPVRATGAGRVVEADWVGGYGQMVEIDHGGGVTTRYGHLSGFGVAVGTRVEAGQIIGRAGSTGRSTGPHLHYETRINGEAVNPQRFLEAGRMLAADGAP